MYNLIIDKLEQSLLADSVTNEFSKLCVLIPLRCIRLAPLSFLMEFIYEKQM